MTQFSLLPPFQALQRFPVITSAAHRNIHRDTDLVAEQTSSDKFSFLLATKKQLTAQERGGIVKVVTEEITPFKRKGKKLGKQHNASGLVLHTISCKLQQRGGAGAGN